MSGNSPRTEPGQDLLISDNLAEEDLPPVPREPADKSGYAGGWCKERCGRHLTSINDFLRLQTLGAGFVKDILKKLYTVGALEEKLNPELIKVLDPSSSYITCNGELLPGYKYIYRSGYPRPNCTSERWACDFLLKLLFRYNSEIRNKNSTKGFHALDYFGGPMIRDGYEESLNLYPHEVWNRLNDGKSITIVTGKS